MHRFDMHYLRGSVKYMSEAIAKSAGLLEAQAAVYTIEHIRRRHHLAPQDNWGNPQYDEAHLILCGLQSALGVAQKLGYMSGAEGHTVECSEGIPSLATTAKEYVDFLRSIGGAACEPIACRAAMLRSYEPFAPAITTLKNELALLENSDSHPAFLARGNVSAVYAISVGSRSYAVRVPEKDESRFKDIHDYMAAGILGKDIPHLEQIVATSYQDGVTVAELIPGKVLADLTVEEIRRITNGQLSDLVETFIAMNKRGITPDIGGANSMWCPEGGITLLDYASLGSEITRGYVAVGNTVGAIAALIPKIGRRVFEGRRTSPGVFQQELDVLYANLKLLERYETVVTGRFSDVDQSEILRSVNETRQSLQNMIGNYTDPRWVIQQYSRNQPSDPRTR
jgi:hypothetical protein